MTKVNITTEIKGKKLLPEMAKFVFLVIKEKLYYNV